MAESGLGVGFLARQSLPSCRYNSQLVNSPLPRELVTADLWLSCPGNQWSMPRRLQAGICRSCMHFNPFSLEPGGGGALRHSRWPVCRVDLAAEHTPPCNVTCSLPKFSVDMRSDLQREEQRIHGIRNIKYGRLWGKRMPKEFRRTSFKARHRTYYQRSRRGGDSVQGDFGPWWGEL